MERGQRSVKWVSGGVYDLSECNPMINEVSCPVVCNIPQHDTLKLLGLTFQNDCEFSAHAKAKLCKANNKN